MSFFYNYKKLFSKTSTRVEFILLIFRSFENSLGIFLDSVSNIFKNIEVRQKVGYSYRERMRCMVFEFLKLFISAILYSDTRMFVRDFTCFIPGELWKMCCL